jgi:hypothetical protein
MIDKCIYAHFHHFSNHLIPLFTFMIAAAVTQTSRIGVVYSTNTEHQQQKQQELFTDLFFQKKKSSFINLCCCFLLAIIEEK